MDGMDRARRVPLSGMTPLSGMAPRRRLLVAGVLLLAVALAATLTVRACGAGTPSGYPDQSRPGTVLLVPGYGGSQAALSVLAERIRATGRSATVLTLPGDGTGDLVAQAATLDRAVRAERARGSRSVDVIGYSAGGVVVRIWVARHDGAHLARRVVTLGSPFHGASLAATGFTVLPDACPPARQQPVPERPLTLELNRRPVATTRPWP